jgi:hypothetical protein
MPDQDENQDDDNHSGPELETISKFDVLTIRNQEKGNRLELIDSSLLNHVGNNRIRVFVKMNLTEYSNSTDENLVVDNILDIIQTQCQDVNTHRCGTFLELRSEYIPLLGATDDDNQYFVKDPIYWKICTRAEAHELIHQCLEEEVQEMLAIPKSPVRSSSISSSNMNDDEKKKRRRRSSLLRRSLSSGNMLEDQKKRVDMRKSVLISTLQQYDIDEEENDEDENEEGEDDFFNHTNDATYDTIGSLPLSNPDDTSSSQQTESRILKTSTAKSPALRRNTMTSGGGGSSSHSRSSANSNISAARRSSMASAGIRRSSMVAGSNIYPSGSSNSSLRPVLHRSGSWTAPQRSPETVLCTANPLDVIFDTDYQFIANHTGNNRFSVMIQVSMPRYEHLVATAEKSNNNNKSQIKQMCRELIKTVQEHYHGRFLIEAVNEERRRDVDNDDDDNDDEEALQEYWCLSEEKTVAAVEALVRNEHAAKQQVKQPPPHVKEQIIEQLSNIPTTLNAIGSVAITGSSSDMSVASGDVSHTSGSISNVSTADIHKSAVESLQKRKKRQGLTSKISNLVARSTGFRPRLPSRMKKSDRSQSDSALQVTSSSSAVSTSMQPLPSQNMRYASTGVTTTTATNDKLSSLPENQLMYFQPQSERMLNYNQQLAEINEASVDEFYFPHQQQQPQPQPSQPYQQQQQQQQSQIPPYQPLPPPSSRRMTELSDFSQSMIEELLLRLDTENSYSNYYNQGQQ